MLQDVFKDRIIPRIEARYKMFQVLCDENGTVITDGQKAFDGTEIPFTLHFMYSPVEEFLDFLKRNEDLSLRYPFFYINSNSVYKDKDTYTIGELVLATYSKKELTTEQRDANTIPILRLLLKLTIEAMQRDLRMEKIQPKIDVIYGNSQPLDYGDYVDAIRLNNLKIYYNE